MSTSHSTTTGISVAGKPSESKVTNPCDGGKFRLRQDKAPPPHDTAHSWMLSNPGRFFGEDRGLRERGGQRREARVLFLFQERAIRRADAVRQETGFGPVKIERGLAGALAGLLCAGCAWALASAVLIAPDLRGAQQSQAEKKAKNRPLFWGPPNIDAPLRSRISSPPCVLADALQQAGARANEFVSNLQNFTAQEMIEYEALGSTGKVRDTSAGTFDYVVVLESTLQGTSVQESRNPERGGHLFPASTRDVGLPSMALIFLAELQGDYEMSCEGTTKWNAQPAWVVHFRQRKDKPVQTVAFRGDKGAVYPAKLKGRAWIASDSGEVMHLETSLVESAAPMHIRDWYLSIDYAPVKFRTQNVSIWLPQNVDSYCEYEDFRTITYHTFGNFMLFSVHTDQEIEKPQNR